MIQKQTIDIPFTKGIDTKSDPKLSAKPTRLENAVFSETGQGGTISKRPGSAPIGSMSSLDGAAAFKNQLIVGKGSMAYQQTTLGATSDGGLAIAPPCTLGVQGVVMGSQTQFAFDHATGSGMSVFAWLEGGTQAGLHIAVMDEATGSFYRDGGAAISLASFPQSIKCLYVGSGVFHVYFVAGTAGHNVNLITVSTSSPTTLSATSTLRTDCVGTGGDIYSGSMQDLDAVILPSGNIAVSYIVTGSNSYTVMLVNPAGTVLGSPAPTTVSATGLSQISTAADNSGNIYVCLNGTGNAWEYSVHSQTTLAQTLGVTSISGTATANTTIPGSACCFNGSNAALLAVNAFMGSPATPTVCVATLGTTGVVSGFSVLASNSCVAACPFSATLGGVADTYIPIYPTYPTNTNSSSEPVVVVLNSSAMPVAKILPGLVAIPASPLGGRLPSICQPSSGTYSLLVGRRGRLSFYSSSAALKPNPATALNISRATITFGGLEANQTATLDDVLFIAGAQPQIYDGNGIYDAGFALYPEPLSVSLVGGASTGNLSAGTYQATAVYSWTDHNGRLHRSAAAIPVSQTVVNTGNFTISIPPLNVTSKDVASLGSNCIIEVYRTQANGTIFYREDDPGNPTLNYRTNTAISFTCTLADAAIASNEVLYTTGGVLDSIAPPACKYVAARNERLIVAGLEDPLEWRYSTQLVKGEFVRFNELLAGRVPSTKGNITGLAVLDDKLIFFCERGIWMVYGDGAGATGANNTFTAPQPLPSDVGCDSWQSIVETPDGLIFHSPKGFHLLGHDLSVQYIGAEVEAYNSYNVRSALMLSDQKQVRFQLDQGSDVSTGICLVWDYFYRTWGTFPSYGGIGAVSWQNKYTRVRSDGSILQETPGAFSDSGSPYSTLIETEWIHVAGIQGFQRILNVLLLGAWDGLSNYTLTVDVGYNYDTAYDTVNDRFTVAVNSTNFSTTGPMQIRHKPRIQKCEAIRLRIQDGNISSPFSGLSLSSLALEVGVKKGAFKLPAGRTV